MDIFPINVKYDHVPLTTRLEHLVGTKFRSDFTFIIEDDNAEIPAHKLILALSSPVLDRIVHGNDTFAASDTIKVDGISRESFMQILQYIYTDKIAINDENVFEILNKSNYFGLTGIEEKCFEYLEEHLNVSTVPWIYHQLFYTFSSSNVFSKCLQYIRIQPMQFFTSEYFEKISVDELKSILRMDTINCTEVDLFKAMIKLSSYHCAAGGLEVTGANQRKVLDGTERLLRLESVTESEFDDCVAIQKDFFSLYEIERIRADIKKSDLTAVKRKWYTYQNAVWIEIVDGTEMPPSSFYSGSKLFIYRRCKEDEEPQVAGDFNQFASKSKIEVLCGSGYEWHKCVNGEIPFGSVTISQMHSEPLFIARGISFERKLYIANSYMNGKMVIPRQIYSKCMSFDERSEYYSSQQLSDFEILVANNVKNPFNGSGVPRDAIFIGFDENNYKTYLGRAWYRGDLLPAKVSLQLGAFVSYDVDEIQVDEFEFVRMDAGTYEWEEGNNGEVPINAVNAGRTISGETLYFGRVLYNGHYIPGKVHGSHKVLYVPYRGQEIDFQSYEVLVQVKDLVC